MLYTLVLAFDHLTTAFRIMALRTIIDHTLTHTLLGYRFGEDSPLEGYE